MKPAVHLSVVAPVPSSPDGPFKRATCSIAQTFYTPADPDEHTETAGASQLLGFSWLRAGKRPNTPCPGCHLLFLESKEGVEK